MHYIYIRSIYNHDICDQPIIVITTLLYYYLLNQVPIKKIRNENEKEK